MKTLSSLLHVVTLLVTVVLAPHSTGDETKIFSHSDWAAVLQTVVDDHGLVDYHELASDRVTLDRYLEQVRTISPVNRPELFPTPDDELAYYVNAYNALVIGEVLRKGPDTDTVWGFTGTGYGFFVRQKVTLGGRSMSLKALEDDIVRGEFQDPRIHAALNCASISCPRLPREPFLGETLSEQLDTAMKEFVTDERHVRQEDDRVFLSKIFEWFRQDFLAFERRTGSETPSLLSYVNRYRPMDQRLDPGLEVSYLDYDKRLNRQP